MARSNPPRVLIDACGLIAIIRDEPGADRLDGLMDMIARGDAQLVESVQILGEVYKKSDAEDPGTRRDQDDKLKNIRVLLESRDVELLDVTLPIVRKATEFRQANKMKLPDAVHLATAVLNKCDWMVTLDGKFPEIEGLKTFRLKHLEDSSVGLPWEGPLQKELFDLPDARLPDEDIVFDQPAVSNNVIPMRQPGSPDTEVAGS